LFSCKTNGFPPFVWATTQVLLVNVPSVAFCAKKSHCIGKINGLG